jgi:hypothetical protein
VPLTDGTPVATPDVPDDDLIPSFLAASDVLGTGSFGAVAWRGVCVAASRAPTRSRTDPKIIRLLRPGRSDPTSGGEGVDRLYAGGGERRVTCGDREASRCRDRCDETVGGSDLAALRPRPGAQLGVRSCGGLVEGQDTVGETGNTWSSNLVASRERRFPRGRIAMPSRSSASVTVVRYRVSMT